MTVQDILMEGFSAAPRLERLRAHLVRSMCDKAPLATSVNELLREAKRRDPGTVFYGVYSVNEESTRNPLLSIDDNMKPYYGYVEPALQELYAMGLHQPFGEMWLDYFLKDHAVYRVNTTCCMCAAGAVLAAGLKTRLGNPTRKALSMYVAPQDTPVVPDHIPTAVTAVGVPMLTLSVELEVTS